MALNLIPLVLDLYDGGLNLISSGSATLIPSSQLNDVVDQFGVLLSPLTVGFHPDASPMIQIVPTDNENIQPSGWAWQITFNDVTGAPEPYYFNIAGSGTVFSFTATGPTFTAAGSSFSNGTGVVLTGSSLPGGFWPGTIYYVVGAAGAAFSLAASPGGSAIASTSTGSGEVTVVQYLSSLVSTLDVATVIPLSVAAGGTGSSTQNWQGLLTPVTVTQSSGSYSASAGALVKANISGGSWTIDLPNAPPNDTIVGAKVMSNAPGNTNTLTIACQGSDMFEQSSGGATTTLLLSKQASAWQYNSGYWTRLSDDLPLGQLDLRYQPVVNIANYGALTSASDNGPAINAAIAALTGGHGTVYIPPGIWSYTTQINLNGANNVRLVGSVAASGVTNTSLLYTGTGSAAAISATGSGAVCFENLFIEFGSASFSGYLIDYSGTSSDTALGIISGCYLGSAGVGVHAAALVCLNHANSMLIENCYLSGGLVGVLGMNAVSSYSNKITIDNCQFINNNVHIQNAAQAWMISNNTFEPCTGGTPGVYNQTYAGSNNLSFVNNWMGDITATSGSQIYWYGTGLVVEGNYIGSNTGVYGITIGANDCDAIYIAGNAFADGAGISFGATTGHTGVTIISNYFGIANPVSGTIPASAIIDVPEQGTGYGMAPNAAGVFQFAANTLQVGGITVASDTVASDIQPLGATASAGGSGKFADAEHVHIAAIYGSNLLSNPDFASGTSGWSAGTNSGTALTNAPASFTQNTSTSEDGSGTCGQVVTNTVTYYEGIWAPLTGLAANTTYIFYAYVEMTSGSQALDMICYDYTNGIMGTPVNTTTPCPSTWTRLSATITTGSTGNATVYAAIRGNSTATSTWLVSAAFFGTVEPFALTTNNLSDLTSAAAARSNLSLTPGAWLSGGTMTGALSLGSTNLISNPDFASSTTGWNTSSSYNTNVPASLTRLTGQSADLSGTCAQVVTNTSNSLEGTWTQVTGLAANTTYTCSAYVMMTSGSQAVSLALRDTTNSVSGTTVTTSNPCPSIWTLLTTTITTGATGSATVQVALRDSSAAACTFLISAVYFGLIGSPAIVFSPMAYGAAGNGTTDDTAAVQAAFAAAHTAGGGTVDLGNYVFLTSSPIAMVAYISYRVVGGAPQGGQGTTGAIINNTSDVFTVPSATGCVRFENCAITASAGHIWNATSSSCSFWSILNTACFQSSNSHCIWYQPNAAGSAVVQAYSNMLVGDGCYFIVSGGAATIPPWYVITETDTNSNTWRRLQAANGSSPGVPFFYLESTGTTSSQLATDNVFEDITGELVTGGILALYSTQATLIRNVQGWDTTFAGDVFYIGTSSTGLQHSDGTTIINSGRRACGLAGGRYDVHATSDTTNLVLINANPEYGATISLSVPPTTTIIPAPTVTAATYQNTGTGGSATTAVTTGNSGGSSGTAFSGVTGTVTFDSTEILTGGSSTLAYKFVGSASAAYVNWTVPNVPAAQLPIQYYRAYVYFTAFPTGVTSVFGSPGLDYCLNLVATGPVWHVQSPSAVTTGVTTPVVNTWYRVEMSVNQLLGTTTVRIYTLSGALIEQISATGGTYQSCTTAYFGMLSSYTGTFWLANLGWSNQGWLGP